MSKNWKTRIKIGGIWGMSTAIISSLFEFFEPNKNFDTIYLTYSFLFKLLVFIIFGIIFFAYGFTQDENNS